MADELDRILQELGDDLKDLSRVMKSTFNIFNKGNTASAKTQVEIDKVRKNLLDTLVKEKRLSQQEANAAMAAMSAEKGETKATKEATQSVNKFRDRLDEFVGRTTKLKDLPGEIVSGFVETGKKFIGAGNKIDGLQSALSGFDGVQIAGMKLSDLGSVVDFNAGVFKQLSQQGAGFGKSVIALRDAARDATMPVLDFTDLVSKNSTTLGRLFGSVEQGIPALTTFTRQLRDRTKNELAEFGLNLDETSEFLGTVLELERARGNANRIAQMDLVGATVNYTKNLVELSKLTGQSVDELNQQNMAMSANGAFLAQLNGLSKEEADRMSLMAGTMGRLNPALGQMFEEVFALGAPISETSRALAAMSGGAIVDAINAFKAGAMSNEEFMNAMRAATNTSNLEGFADAAYAGGQFGEAMNAVVALQGAQSTMLDEEMNARGDNTKALVAAKDQLQEFKSFTEQAGTATLDLAMNKLPELCGKLNEGFDTFDKHFKGRYPDLGQTLMSVGKGMALRVFDIGSNAMRGAKEFIFKGEDGNNMLDNIMGMFGSNQGTVNPTATLTPEQRNAFSGLGATTSVSSNIVSSLASPDGPNIPTTPTEMTGSNTVMASNRESNFEALLEEMRKNNKALNTVVTIMDKTEKNTKDTKNNLANMGGSLV